jgi:hypothetical protein
MSRKRKRIGGTLLTLMLALAGASLGVFRQTRRWRQPAVKSQVESLAHDPKAHAMLTGSGGGGLHGQQSRAASQADSRPPPIRPGSSRKKIQKFLLFQNFVLAEFGNPA